MNKKIESFLYNGERLSAIFKETLEVFPGVHCDVYIHPETQKRDLAIIMLDPGKKTLPQKVLMGEETIEGYISGSGKLIIRHVDGTQSVFDVGPGSEGFSHPVGIGEIMQWKADKHEELVFFEICLPPYEDGRYENLTKSPDLDA